MELLPKHNWLEEAIAKLKQQHVLQLEEPCNCVGRINHMNDCNKKQITFLDITYLLSAFATFRSGFFNPSTIASASPPSGIGV